MVLMAVQLNQYLCQIESSFSVLWVMRTVVTRRQRNYGEHWMSMQLSGLYLWKINELNLTSYYRVDIICNSCCLIKLNCLTKLEQERNCPLPCILPRIHWTRWPYKWFKWKITERLLFSPEYRQWSDHFLLLLSYLLLLTSSMQINENVWANSIPCVSKINGNGFPL